MKEIDPMTNRRTKLIVFAAAAFITLLIPTTASAQRPWWEQGRNRDNDIYGRRGRTSDRDRRFLRDVARRIDDRSKSFERNVDRSLDNSRIDDTRREDNINDRVRDFRRAAARFRDRAGDNDFYRSEQEARTLLSSAGQIDRLVRRIRLDGRAQSDWSQIRSDLRTVADFYGLRLSDYDGGRNDDDWRRDRNRRNNGGLQWPRNWPRPF
jgi:hypothetical protein